MTKITIGARSSNLSLAYVSRVKDLLIKNNEELNETDIKVKTITTTGDIKQDVRISEVGGKNLFCKEIEENLLKDNIDIAVHSLKDMESLENPDLIIGAYIERNDPRDALISDNIKNIKDLEKKIKIGSSSRRRELQLKRINKNILVEHVRGNIDTRVEKLEKQDLDGIILAAAGIKSLNLENKVGLFFETKEILPAAGQGIIAVQCKENNKAIKNIIKKINHTNTSLCAIAERKMLQTIGGDCDTAIGGFAEIKDNNLKLKSQLFSDSGDESFEYELVGRDVDAAYIGKSVGEKLLSLAGTKFKKK
ncbi:hydroxymethylbilane synthase [Pelagibacterales bacterium SAG-MED28]|nr:hydroxymethylbilane synthase [Pelagibacterales bacterium SAG-MED28]